MNRILQLNRLLDNLIQFSLAHRVAQGAVIASGGVIGSTYGFLGGALSAHGNAKRLQKRIQTDEAVKAKPFLKERNVRYVGGIRDLDPNELSTLEKAALPALLGQAHAGNNAYAVVTKKKKHFVIAGDRAPKFVLAHEAGHIRDFQKHGDPRWYEHGVPGAITGKLLKREKAAWAESGVPPDEDALTTYRRAQIGTRIGAAVGITGGIIGAKAMRMRFNQLLDDLIQFDTKKKLHQPDTSDEPPGQLPIFKEGSIVDYNVQRHHARRAGLHRDVRIGDRRHGLLSWATKKQPPAHGEKIAIHQQPTHPHSYLGWSGEIPSGYGAGNVKSEDLGKALVTKSTPDELHATLADRKGSHRLAFIKTDHGWILSKGRTPQPQKEASKPPAKTLLPQKSKSFLSELKTGSSVQPKIDGALVYVSTAGGRPEIFSHRISKTTGQRPVHTERVFRGRPTIKIPREHQRTLIGELYGKVRGKSIPPQELGGILNAHIGESIRKQKQQGVRLKVMPFDVVGDQGPYRQRLEKLKSTVSHLPRRTFHPPEEATTPSASLRLYEKVRSGKHPLTKEGIIIHPPQGKMIKVKHMKEANVKISGTFPGTGKFEGHPGGFTYSNKGQVVGKVGTGFTDETRKDLDKYIGRTARIKHQGKYKSGAYRAPSLIAIEENK